VPSHDVAVMFVMIEMDVLLVLHKISAPQVYIAVDEYAFSLETPTRASIHQD
jgi:hypothetical protein